MPAIICSSCNSAFEHRRKIKQEKTFKVGTKIVWEYPGFLGLSVQESGKILKIKPGMDGHLLCLIAAENGERTWMNSANIDKVERITK